MVNVLISSVSSSIDPTYLPYIYGLLKTHCDQDDRLSEAVRWLPPIYRRNEPEKLLEDYDVASLDVLGLSCYAWNWLAQMGLARRVKEVNPDCLVVAGGPHCDYDDPDFFRKNPQLDLVVRQEGEEPFRRILLRVLNDERDWESIPGLYHPGQDGEPVLTAHPETLAEEEILDVSPYAAEADRFRQMVREAKDRGESLATMIESNRGCPYRCSFCDWGSLTYTKVRKFSMDRVRRDIDWLTRQPIDVLHITDANVGMFERDVDIVEYLCEQKERHGYPNAFMYNPTKTKATHIPTIVGTLDEHDLIPRSVISLQHTDPDVLDAIERRNLTDEEIRDLIDFNLENDIPMDAQLILGCPNDTYEKWKSCLTDLMEMGIDGEWLIYNFEVLPNAPAGDPEYMEKWGIETTRTRNLPKIGIDRSTHVPDLAMKHMVTRTDSFDEEDWCRMWNYTFLLQGFHCLGLTQKLSLYLRYVEEVPFETFYEDLVDTLCQEDGTLFSRLYDRLYRAKQAFLEGEDKPLDRTELQDFPDYSYYPKWDEWVFIQTVLNRERAFAELEAFVLDRYNVHPERTRDLVDYQRETVVAPDYDPREGKTFTGNFAWMEYFDRDRDRLDDPPVRERRRFVIDETILGGERDVSIDWHHHAGDDRICSWIDIAVRDPIRRLDHLTAHTVRSQPLPSLFQSVTNRLRRSIREVAGVG